MVNSQRAIGKNEPKYLKLDKRVGETEPRSRLHAECCTSDKIKEVAVCEEVGNRGGKDMENLSMLMGRKKGGKNSKS